MSKKVPRKVIATLAICVGIFVAAGAGVAFIFATEPTAQRQETTKKTAMLVQVETARAGTYRPTIEALGTVVAIDAITLRPRVGGEVVALAPDFRPGATVDKGDRLLKIDPTDYQAELRQRESELAQAKADLALERGQQEIAKSEYRLLDESLSEERKALVLRQPQYESAVAQVERAQAAVKQARLNLERTEVVAPFPAQVLSREVSTGSMVSTGDTLARLAGWDAYWVETAVPVSKLRWLAFDQQAPVEIRNQAAWGPDQHREGQLDQLVGELDPESRLATVLVRVPDPLAKQKTAV